MRSRNIKPGFFKNDVLADCDPLARLLFIGLWCMADRQGRIEYRQKKIKVELLPYDSCVIGKLIQQLVDGKFITVYSVNNENYIEINNFLKHQTPHIKEQASTIPAPDKNQTSMSEESLIPDSLNLIPDSLNLIPDSLNPIPDAPDKSGWRDRFDSFWKAYPKKVGKKEAQRAWQKASDLPSIEMVLKAIAVQKSSDAWKKDNGQFIPNPATWLNQGRWEDEPGQRNSSGGSRIPEYKGEHAELSPEERAKNVERIRSLAGAIGAGTLPGEV